MRKPPSERMIRMDIHITPQQYEALYELSNKLNVSMADIIRKGLDLAIKELENRG